MKLNITGASTKNNYKRQKSSERTNQYESDNQYGNFVDIIEDNDPLVENVDGEEQNGQFKDASNFSDDNQEDVHNTSIDQIEDEMKLVQQEEEEKFAAIESIDQVPPLNSQRIKNNSSYETSR